MRTQWQRVLNEMRRYNRKAGYVDEIDGRLMFFDSDPNHNGIHALYVTINDVKRYLTDAIGNEIKQIKENKQ